MWWDRSNFVAKPAPLRTDLGALALNQRDFQTVFLGVANDQRLATEPSTTPQSDRTVTTDGIFDCDCPSQTWDVDDLVGIDRSATPANYAQQVNKVTNPCLAIGKVVARATVATTKVRCRLTSSLICETTARYDRGIGGAQGQGTTALADAAGTLTVASTALLNMTPTAARSVTLPAEAQSAGLVYFFANLSGGAFSVTFLGSLGGSIKGNGVVPQNKTAYLWCDGTNWYGLVSA